MASAEASLAGIGILASNPVAGPPLEGPGCPRAVASAVGMALKGLGLHQLEEGRGAPGQERHHLAQTGVLDLAGLTGAIPAVGRTLNAGDHFENRLVLALSVAGAGLGTVEEGTGAVGHGGLRRIVSG